MYDICTGVVKDPHRLQQKIEADRATLEARASKIGAEEMMRVRIPCQHSSSRILYGFISIIFSQLHTKRNTDAHFSERLCR